MLLWAPRRKLGLVFDFFFAHSGREKKIKTFLKYLELFCVFLDSVSPHCFPAAMKSKVEKKVIELQDFVSDLLSHFVDLALVGRGASWNNFVRVTVILAISTFVHVKQEEKKRHEMTNSFEKFHKVGVLRTEWEIPEYYDSLSLSRRSAFGIYWWVENELKVEFNVI